jgi:hypothetical protein
MGEGLLGLAACLEQQLVGGERVSQTDDHLRAGQKPGGEKVAARRRSAVP